MLDHSPPYRQLHCTVRTNYTTYYTVPSTLLIFLVLSPTLPLQYQLIPLEQFYQRSSSSLFSLPYPGVATASIIVIGFVTYCLSGWLCRCFFSSSSPSPITVHSTVQYSTVQYSTLHSTVQSTVQYSPALYNLQYSPDQCPVQYSTLHIKVQYSVQCSTI